MDKQQLQDVARAARSINGVVARILGAAPGYKLAELLTTTEARAGGELVIFSTIRITPEVKPHADTQANSDHADNPAPAHQNDDDGGGSAGGGHDLPAADLHLHQ